MHRFVVSRGNTPLPEDQTRHLPRILCLHGGGVTAEVFRLQARAIIKHLPDFRLVFADGPFFANPGPGIAPVYEEFGPFRRWLRWLPEHPPVDDDTAIDEIMYAIESAKRQDEGNGPWVGILGFSQGAKMTSSLLYDQQIRNEVDGRADTDYKFGVLLAGRSAIVSLCDYSKGQATDDAGGMNEAERFTGESPHVLRIPTLHVHGLSDPGLDLHRKMMNQYHEANSVTLFEWQGEHRVPIKKLDVEPIAKEIYRIARAQGVRV